MVVLQTLLVLGISFFLIHPYSNIGPLGFIAGILDGSAKLTRIFSRYKDSDVFPPKELPEIYDFIIVGASPTGSVIANRLSQISKWKILLIEAGGEPSVLAEIPAACSGLAYTEYDWGYYTEQQEGHCTGCINHSIKFSHGKCLGGSTCINFMIYARGNRHDYDRWASMGNTGWSYEDVLPYFRKSENSHLTIFEPDYHGVGGELGVSDTYHTKVSYKIVAAAEEAGHQYVDYNGKNQIGVGLVQTMTSGGRRCDGENAFLRPIRHRKNLNIRMRALVTKILIKPYSKVAYGVEYVKNGKTYKAFATKEVIISAGASIHHSCSCCLELGQKNI